MSINLSTVRDVTIAKVHTLAVDPSKFNADVLEYIFAYGLKQVLNDAGSAGKDADQKRDMALVKLDALYNGELRKARESGEPADPVGKEAYRIAGEMVARLLGRIYKGEWKCPDMARAKAFAAKNDLDLSDAAEFLESARKIVAKSDRVRAEAKANVESAAALADLI
jgi:hypothetical protein